MPDDRGRSTEGNPVSPPCSLREACVAAKLDRGGERCPACRLLELCRGEGRWLVKAALLQ
jgi:hypothetical protein